MSAIKDELVVLKIFPESSTPTKDKYRPEIDGLRAFAVVAVIVNHFNKDLLPSGYLGVDVFFVISGYVITSSMVKPNKNFWDFISGFYVRRIKRLVPALLVFVLIISALICLINPVPEKTLTTGIASLLGLSNINLFNESTEYFAQATELNPFTHTWSLGVEEQFYLLFPLLIWFSGFSRQTTNGARNLALWIGPLTLASLTGFIYLYQMNQPAAYFLMPPRFWEMSTGCLVFVGFQKREKIEQTLEQVPPLLVVGLMVGVMLLPIAWAPVSATILIVVLSSIVIACLKKGTAAYTVFTNKQVVYIGLISYSLYLWHYGVLSMSRWTIGIHWWTAPFQVAAIWLLADSSYRIVEKPARMTKLIKSPKMIISVGIASVALCSALIGVISKNADRIYKAGVSTLPIGYRKEDNRIVQALLKCRDGKLPQCLTRDPYKSAIFVIGDSHAENHIPSIESALRKQSNTVQVRHWWSSGFWTALEGGENFNNQRRGDPRDLQKFKYLIQTKLQKGDIIIISWYRNRILKNFGAGQSIYMPLEDPKKISALYRELSGIAAIVANKSATLLLVDDIPQVCELEDFSGGSLSFERDVLFMGRTGVCRVPKETSIKQRLYLTNLLKKVSNHYPSVHYIDFHDDLCEKTECGLLDPKDNLRLLYGDYGSHFRISHASPLAKEWVVVLSRYLPKK